MHTCLGLELRVMVGMVFNATFNNIFSDSVAVSFIGGGKGSTWRKTPTNRKLLTNFPTGFELTTLVVIGTGCIRSRPRWLLYYIGYLQIDSSNKT